MTKQWHNPQIAKKPFTRYNPSLRNKIAKAYKPWYIVVALLQILLGIGLIAIPVAMKQFDGDLKDKLFHLWVGVPLLVTGILACVAYIIGRKKWAVIFLIFSIIMMVVCATAAIAGGLHYWMDAWHQSYVDLGDDQCAKATIAGETYCKCKNVGLMPSKQEECDDLDHTVKMFIAVIALDAGSFAVCVAAVFLSFMSVCCGPWMYMEWYDPEHDPDFAKEAPVKQVGKANLAYGQ